ncbi:hypothetical protein FOTG_16060 [Fusarium oxysporum f. sp. vasinfectum 25433]|uniref:BZIP domain-containing protein n=1 Tax=Fusarium oxysporum f. sp. vasinfectum 25433 TaxID=1089449 RepID=X0KPS3_FUSOX|nr:hypothetical protein FOTG_16060 [Fusarium oxysporum f. sp. vasinfectum 25433]
MGGDSTFATSYTPQSLLWEQWWPSNQLVPFGSSEDKRSTASDVYTLTDDWQYTKMNCTNPWNGLNPVVEDVPLFPAFEDGISKESLDQGYWHSPSLQRTPDRKTNCYSDNLKSRKPSKRPPLGDRDINPQTMKKRKYSPVRRTNHTSSNGTHPAQQDNDRMKRIRERNRIASNKLRFKHREEQQGLESSKQDLERIHRDLSTCVADLTFEVYELKMQLLQQSGCNCILMQNYLIHESGRYIQALKEKSQREALHRRL